MGKKNKPGFLGIHRRKKLLSICNELHIGRAAMMPNRDIIVAIVSVRPQIKLGQGHQANAELIIQWFTENEPAALQHTVRRVAPHQDKEQPRAKRGDFYSSWEWRTLRMEVLKSQGFACQCCGANSSDRTMSGGRVRLCVDHIKPLSKHWDLRLDPDNLQVLCDECNQGKGAWDQTDHRPSSTLQ